MVGPDMNPFPIISGKKRFGHDELASLDVSKSVILTWRGADESITDAQWNQVRSLLCAAPSLLTALERLAHPMADEDDLAFAKEVIARAKGGAK
jgi:hypothetical protein